MSDDAPFTMMEHTLNIAQAAPISFDDLRQETSRWGP